MTDWEAAVGNVADIHACASCGVEDFQAFSLHTVEVLAVLALTPDEDAKCCSVD